MGRLKFVLIRIMSKLLRLPLPDQTKDFDPRAGDTLDYSRGLALVKAKDGKTYHLKR